MFPKMQFKALKMQSVFSIHTYTQEKDLTFKKILSVIKHSFYIFLLRNISTTEALCHSLYIKDIKK